MCIIFFKKGTEGNRVVLWRGNKTSVLQALYGLCLGDVIFPESSRMGWGKGMVERVHFTTARGLLL
jgi:hypothetical protein